MTQLPVVICRTCDRALDRLTTPKGVSFVHAAIDTDDHPPTPVDAPPHWRGRCDFCTTSTAEHVVPTRDFTAPHAPNLNSLGDWAACPMCAMLIESNRWNNLLQRAITAHETLHGHPATEQQISVLRALHRTIRGAITGAIRPIPPAPEPAMTVEQARTILYQRIYGHDQQPSRHGEPGTEQGQERLDADCLRLAAMDPDAFIADADAVATALEIADQLRWDS